MAKHFPSQYCQNILSKCIWPKYIRTNIHCQNISQQNLSDKFFLWNIYFDNIFPCGKFLIKTFSAILSWQTISHHNIAIIFHQYVYGQNIFGQIFSVKIFLRKLSMTNYFLGTYISSICFLVENFSLKHFSAEYAKILH